MGRATCLATDVDVFVFGVGEIVASSSVCRSSGCLIEVIAGYSMHGRMSMFGVLTAFVFCEQVLDLIPVFCWFTVGVNAQ